MFERLDTVDGNNRNVVAVTSQQIRITFNVDLIKRIFIRALGRFDGLLGFVAEMTTRAAVDDDVSFLLNVGCTGCSLVKVEIIKTQSEARTQNQNIKCY